MVQRVSALQVFAWLDPSLEFCLVVLGVVGRRSNVRNEPLTTTSAQGGYMEPRATQG